MSGTTEGAQSVSDLPQWAQDKISELRNEAAGHRTRANEARDRAKAELESEFKAKLDALEARNAEVVAENNDYHAKNLRIEAAIAAGVPTEHVAAFAERLRGSTPDEVKADAESAKALFGLGGGAATPPAAVDPSQGHGEEGPAPDAATIFGQFIDSQLRK